MGNSRLASIPFSRPVRRAASGIALLVCVAPMVTACSASDEPSPADATLTETTYENTYFGFTLPLPSGWSVATPEAEEHIREIGKQALASDDPQLRASIEASAPKTFQLLTLTEHPVGAPVAFNPTIVVLAENVAHAPGVKTGADYLFHLAANLARGSIPYEPLGEVSATELGGRPFHRMDFEVAPPSGISQSYLFAREGTYVLGFVATARDQVELKELLGLVSQVRFD